jgi:hypothetical protein
MTRIAAAATATKPSRTELDLPIEFEKPGQLGPSVKAWSSEGSRTVPSDLPAVYRERPDAAVLRRTQTHNTYV